jgi:hypothetical protein
MVVEGERPIWEGRVDVRYGALLMGVSVFENGRALEWDVNIEGGGKDGVVVGAGILSGWFAVLSTTLGVVDGGGTPATDGFQL